MKQMIVGAKKNLNHLSTVNTINGIFLSALLLLICMHCYLHNNQYNKIIENKEISDIDLEETVIYNLSYSGLNHNYKLVDNHVVLHCISLFILVSIFCVFFLLQHKKNNEIEKERNEIKLKEELYHTATTINKQDVARYNIETKDYYCESEALKKLGFDTIIKNVPQSFIDIGNVSEISINDFNDFYQNINEGISTSVVVNLKYRDDQFGWFKMDSKIIVDKNNKPVEAIIAYKNVTEQRLQEAVYARWQNSLNEKKEEDYTLYRCNLTKSTSFMIKEGSLININFNVGDYSFRDRTLEFASQHVHKDDFEKYIKIVNSDYLLAQYYRGNRTINLDFRELNDNKYRWLRLTVDMVQYRDSKDIEVFLMYENIDKSKNEEILSKIEAETDSLTNVLNRAAFIEKFEAILHNSSDETSNCLILLDVDGFRLLNEKYGHASGDIVLQKIAIKLKETISNTDLIGRLGGDEFMICLTDIANKMSVEKKVAQILKCIKSVYFKDFQISASAGVVLSPENGTNFDLLYHNVDLALFQSKKNGRDIYTFYTYDIKENDEDEQKISDKKIETVKKSLMIKNKMIIIDDDSKNNQFLRDLFGKRFNIEVADTTEKALLKIRRYNLSTAIILLSSDFDDSLLENIRNDESLMSIPVMIMSKDNNHNYGLEMLRKGASDFITKPIDSDLIDIKVSSLIEKEENERVRIHNKFIHINDEEKSKYRIVIENMKTIIVEQNWLNGKFTYDINTSNVLFGNYDERTLWHIFLSDMVANSMDVKKMQQIILGLVNDRKKMEDSMEVLLKTIKNEKHWFKMMFYKRVNEFNSPIKIIMTFTDINASIIAKEKLIYQAERDNLTGLYNRRTFLLKTQELTRDAPCNTYVLLTFDIDHFRFINERYGREEGDKLLIYTGKKMAYYAEKYNTICSRLSNDYFALILKNDQNIMKETKINMLNFFEGYPLPTKITFRGGACVCDDPSLPMDNMLDRASIARRAIKNKYDSEIALFTDEMQKVIQEEKEITEKMEKALINNEFDIYIQPQFNHITGKIVGGEALVRWMDPDKGIISPASFIPLFERNGFITKLDPYIWEKAAKSFYTWNSTDNLVPLSVNVSIEDINEPNFCDCLVGIIKKYNIPANMFRLEITETVFASNTEHIISVMNNLHSLGFIIEMDDFGSGYSSLNILKSIPVDIIKLDMKFMGNENKEKGGVIVSSVIRMVRWLNIPIIAEGVETLSQADFLLSIGCHNIQGYLYSKPLPIKQLKEKIVEKGIETNAADIKISNLEGFNPMTFWDPVSFDTVLFNDLIGPAFIFEYCNDKYDIIRMNKKFFEKLGYKNTEVMSAVKGLSHIKKEDLPIIKEKILKAIEIKKEVYLICHRILDDETIQNLNVSIRLLACNGSQYLLFCTIK